MELYHPRHNKQYRTVESHYGGSPHFYQEKGACRLTIAPSEQAPTPVISQPDLLYSTLMCCG
jgi:hypothetical protein